MTVIATDKTGTLTENRLRVLRLESEAEALRCLALCNDADPRQSVGDPLELALYAHVRARGQDPLIGLEAWAAWLRPRKGDGAVTPA